MPKVENNEILVKVSKFPNIKGMVLTRENYLKHISNNLAVLQNSIDFRTKSNLHDLGIIAEDFVRDLLNIIFGFQLENLNSMNYNQAGIDLGDYTNKIAIQITSTTSRQKIKTTIDKVYIL